MPECREIIPNARVHYVWPSGQPLSQNDIDRFLRRRRLSKTVTDVLYLLDHCLRHYLLSVRLVPMHP